MAKPKNDNRSIRHRWILKIILNLWTILTLALLIVDFFAGGAFDSSASAIGIIYLALLGIYISEKEYSRWKGSFKSAFLGEIFVIVWTIVMVIFVLIAPISDGQYHVPGEFGIIYASVVAAFAISQHSKAMRQK